MNPNSKIPSQFLYPYLDAIRKYLPPEITAKDSDVYEILSEIEAHLMDLIFDMAETGQITDEIIQKAMKQMGDPKSIALEYHELFKRKNDLQKNQTEQSMEKTMMQKPFTEPAYLDISPTMFFPTQSKTTNNKPNFAGVTVQNPMKPGEKTPEEILMQPVRYKEDKKELKENIPKLPAKVSKENQPSNMKLFFKNVYLMFECLFGLIFLIIGLFEPENERIWYLVIGGLILLDCLIMGIQIARKLTRKNRTGPMNIFEILIEFTVIGLLIYINLFHSTIDFEVVSFTMGICLMGIRLSIILLNSFRNE